MARVAAGHCWADNAVLLQPDADGWRVCTVCDRRFRFTPDARTERIPVAAQARGTSAGHSLDTYWVLATGETVRADGKRVPELARYGEFRWPPAPQAPLPPSAGQ